MLQSLIELFKTPAGSSLVTALTAVVSVWMTQHFSRKTAQLTWLREQRARAYAYLIDSLDELASILFRLSNETTPAPEQLQQRYSAAAAHYRGACSFTDLFGRRDICELVKTAQAEFGAAAAGPDVRARGHAALERIKPQDRRTRPAGSSKRTPVVGQGHRVPE